MTLIELTKTPENQRDSKWENQFFKALSEGVVELVSESPQYGPDGWPYLLVKTPEADVSPSELSSNSEKTNSDHVQISESSNSANSAISETAKIEPTQKIMNWLSTRGIGMAVNTHKEYPDYVFSYGMIWHFMKTGLFFRPNHNSNSNLELNPNQKIHAGAPTEDYLPETPRKILKEFFRDQGILSPKILLISSDGLNYDLAVSLESLKNPSESEHQGIAEAISWFLPPHYSIILISEKGFPKFVEL